MLPWTAVPSFPRLRASTNAGGVFVEMSLTSASFSYLFGTVFIVTVRAGINSGLQYS